MGIKLIVSFLSGALLPPIATFVFLQSYGAPSQVVLGASAILKIPASSPSNQPRISSPTQSILPSISPTSFPIPTNTPSPTKKNILTPTTNPSPVPTTTKPPQTPTLVPSPTRTPTPILTSTPPPSALIQITSSPTAKPIPSPTTLPVTGQQLDEWFTTYSNHYSIERNKLWNIAVCESGLNPKAVNGDYGGLYQFSTNTWISTRKAMNENSDPSLRFNPEEAIKTAAFKISTMGLSPWPNCNK